MATLRPGVRIRFTGQYLRQTQQARGEEGRKVWTVQPCPCRLCTSGDFVAVDEPSVLDPGEPRHLNTRAVRAIGRPDGTADDWDGGQYFDNAVEGRER
jgi:hypothetical protein